MCFWGICPGRRRIRNNFWIWPGPHPIAPRDKISRKGKPLAPTVASNVTVPLLATSFHNQCTCMKSNITSAGAVYREFLYICWPKTGQNWSQRIDPGYSSYPTKYGLTIFYGDPFQAPGHFLHFHRFPEKSFKSPPHGSRDSRNVIFPINACRKLPISDIGLPWSLILKIQNLTTPRGITIQ